MSRELPYFRWYPADAESDEKYSAMNLSERGLYHAALNFAWMNDGLPIDAAEIARVLRVAPKEFMRTWIRVSPCFQGVDRLRNPRQEKERADAMTVSGKARASASARWSKSERNANALPTHSEGNARASESECVSESESGKPKEKSFREIPVREIVNAIRYPLNGKTSQRWEDFLRLYPLKVELDDASRQFVSVVSTENEGDVFACLERYRASDQVARGAVMKPANWLLTGHRDKWLSDWPKPPETPEERKKRRMNED